MKDTRRNDISETNTTDVALRESEEIMRYAVRHDPSSIAIFDCNLHYIAISNRYLHDYNVREENIIGKHHYEVFPELPQKLKDVHQRCLAGAIERNDDDCFVRPDGSIVYNRWECRPWRRATGEIGGIIVYTEITTDRKNTEKALQESEIKYRSFFENSMDAILLTTADGKILSANPAACTMFGYPENELIKLSKSGIEDVTDPRLSDLMAERKLKGKARGVIAFFRKDGTRFQAEISTSAFINNEGFERSSMIIRDITERQQKEETLLKLSSAVEQTIDTITITDRYGTIEYVNKAFEDITGYTSEEVVGKTPRILKSGIKGLEFYEALWKTILSGKVFKGEVVNKKKNGELFFEQKTISPIFDKNGNITHFVGTGVDISENKRTEEALHESEKLYRSLFENMLNGFAFCKMIFEEGRPVDFIYIAVNKSFEMHTGLKDVTGKKVSEVIPGIRESDPELLEIYGRVALTGKPETIEIYVEGLKMWFSISVYSPKKEYFVAVFDVITSRKIAENELIKAKEKAEESDRLKSAFLANMSHEVRTPLNAIIGFSELLAEPDFEEEYRNEFIHHIINNGNNLLTIISDIMDISKMESGQITIRKSQIKVQKFISDIKNRFTFQVETKKIAFKLTLPDAHDETVIFADADRLGQIFNSLISNAIKFTANGAIEIGYQTKENLVEFYISDTGIGISSEYHDKIFERFRQVESEKTRKYGGNGLGLSISKNLIELMGGKIWVESELGIGSTFYFSLPLLTMS